ncbi:hypothetical protein CF327_g4916 [Tilletia walkeri]|nr:hypothetical protein CF327_g4916 [Tilletia walkeri]
MVQTRAGTLAADAGKAVARSFSQAFPAVKPNVATHQHSSEVAKVTSKRARTVVATASTKMTAGGTSEAGVVRRGRAKAVVKKEPTIAVKTEEGIKKSKKAASVKKEEEVKVPVKMLPDEEARLCTTIDRPELTFSVEEALDHLCAYDVRFEQARHKVGLRTFTSTSSDTQPLNLFQTLVTSILGQQISWMAARAILYKFTRIWWADSLPERPDWDTLARNQLPFPTPRQVYDTSEEKMRAAGLSFSKIRYVKGLAERFGSGEMDVRELIAMEDEQALVQRLCEIKGVGVWTAQMCMMFALRRPSILSHADLGIQKGMVIWHLAGPEGPTIRSETRKKEKDTLVKKEDVNAALDEASTQVRVDAVVSGDEPIDTGIVSGAVATKEEEEDEATGFVTSDRAVPPLPADSGLTMRILQDRRSGKKVKGMYLTPAEMNSLARAWHPYESIASLFMWALVD